MILNIINYDGNTAGEIILVLHEIYITKYTKGTLPQDDLTNDGMSVLNDARPRVTVRCHPL